MFTDTSWKLYYLVDSWGTPLEYSVNEKDSLNQMYELRILGKDGKKDSVESLLVPYDDWDRDLVIRNSMWVQKPDHSLRIDRSKDIAPGYLTRRCMWGEWSGSSFLWFSSEIFVRKFELVYAHWGIFCAFFLVFCLVLAVPFLRKQLLQEISERWNLTLTVYIVLGILLFFNSPFLSHSMMQMPPGSFIKSMLYSMTIAALPVIFIHLDGKGKISTLGSVCFYFILHFIMSVAYIINPIVGME